MIIFGKKVLAGANLVALTIAITPDNVAAQNLDNKPQKQAYTKDKENLATNIQNIVNNLLPNTSDCFEYDPKICRFESEYPTPEPPVKFVSLKTSVAQTSLLFRAFIFTISPVDKPV